MIGQRTTRRSGCWGSGWPLTFCCAALAASWPALGLEAWVPLCWAWWSVREQRSKNFEHSRTDGLYTTLCSFRSRRSRIRSRCWSSSTGRIWGIQYGMTILVVARFGAKRPHLVNSPSSTVTDWLTWMALQSHTKMNVHELLYYTILHYRSWSIESRHHEPVIHSLNPEAFAPGCNDGLVSPEPKPLWSRLRTCFSSHNNTRNLTSHHLLPLCQGNSAAIPAFAIRVLMPATSSRPKTVRRNRVTTSWSRGESRSVFMFSVVWTSTQLLCAHGNIVPLHHPLYRWRCLGWCPLSTPPRRWVGFGSDTIVSYKTGTVEMGRLDYPDAESSSLPGNICLNVLMKNWVLSKLGRFIHLQKLVASHLVRTAVALDYDMASRTQRPDENEPTASNKRQREEYCMGEGCLNMASRRLNANCTVSGLHPGCPQSSTMSWQTSPSSSTMYVYSPSLCTLLTLS